MKVLYLTYDGLSDPLGQSQVMPYLTNLGKLGHEITIISFEKKQNRKLVQVLKQDFINQNIHWIDIFYTKTPPIFSTIYDMYRMWSLCNQLCVKDKFDIIHCRSYVTSIIGNYLKKRFGLKFIFDMRGFYADERIDGGIWWQGKIIYRIIYKYFKKREKDFLTNADYTVCLTEKAKQEIHSWKTIPNQPLPIKVIPCCADTELFYQNKIDHEIRQSYFKKLNIKEENFLLTYVGAVGTWYMLDQMLDFFNRLLLKIPDSVFLFITHEEKSMIQKKASAKGIPEEKIIIYPALHNEVPVLLSLTKASIFFIKPLYSKMASSPAKQGEIMSMGIPIICNSNVGDTDRIIREADGGAIIRSFTDEDYDYVIEELPEILSHSKEKIRQTAIKYFSLDKGVEKYNEIYMSLKS